MLPRWHVFYGAIFTFLFWMIAPNTSIINLALIFSSSILIDLDHYINSIIKTKKIGLIKAFDYHKDLEEKQNKNHQKGIKNKSDFHFFHTIEFHIVIALLGLLWTPFFFIFMGMIFHSLLDLFSLMNTERVYLREYFFSNWLRKKIFK